MSRDETELLQLLQDLIRIDSVNPVLTNIGTGELEIAQYIGNYLEKMGLEVTYQDINSKRANVVGILKGEGGGKTIMLNGHTDTVGIEGMNIDPFNPKFENGKVYGRGALDMKSGLAATIMAVQAIMNAKIKLKGDVILAFVADEENLSLGTERLVKDYSADGAIICEPTDLQITMAHKGFAWIRIEIFGKAAHGSRPEEGVDAIVKAGKVLMEIDYLEKNILPQKQHPLLGAPSIHASLIKGGTELSTYPHYCKIELERRTLPKENRNDVVEEINKIIETISSEDRQFKADFNVYFYRSALEVSQNHSIVHSLDKAYRRVRTQKSRFVGGSYWTDAALLTEAGIPTVIFGPRGEGPHSAIEYVDFESVIATTEILKETIQDFCGVLH
ncbi:MAG: ArgE/DapE family deacylase [Promethearchaeota archaeon]